MTDRPQQSSASKLVGAAGLIAFGHVASRVLGLIRERVIAGYFGTSLEASAFRAAARLPTMVYDLLVGGMLSAALVPVLASYAATRRRELWRAASVLLSVVAAVTGLIALAVYAAAPWLAEMLGGGFPPEGVAVVEQSLRYIAPAIVAFGLAGTITGTLYALERFSLPAMAGAVYNVVFIGALVLIHDRLGVFALALGVTLGSFAQVAFLAPGLRDGRIRPTLDLRHPVVRRVVVLYIPIGVGLLVTQLQVWIDTRLASRAGEMGLAVMSYGTSLIQFPHGFVAVAISLAILPQLSAAYARDEVITFTRMQARGLRTVVALTVPAAVGMAVLAEPIVGAVYQHGMFGDADRWAVSIALYGYLLGLPFAAIDWPLNYAYYARQNTLVPAVVGVFSVFAYLVVAVTLGPVLNLAGLPASLLFVGLVLADTAKQASHAGVMTVLTRRQVGPAALAGMGRTAAASVVAAAVMAAAVALNDRWLSGALPQTTLGWAARAGVGAAVGILVYVPAARLLGVNEIGWLSGVVASRLRGGSG